MKQSRDRSRSFIASGNHGWRKSCADLAAAQEKENKLLIQY